MGLFIEAEDVTRFQEDGAVCLRGVFSREWLVQVEAGIARNLIEPGTHANHADGAAQRFFQDANNWRRIPEFDAFMRRSPARLVAAALMQSSKVNFLHDHVLVKLPGAEKRTPWHQDQPYSPVDGWAFCTMWLPVDPVPRDMTLEFVAGSHRAGKWYRPQRFIDGSLRADDDPRWEVLPTIEPATHRIIGWAVEPGDCVIFHGLTLHGAAGNNSASRARRVLSTRWTGDDARFHRRSGKMSPPPPETGAPEDGAVLDCEAFPVVWRAAPN
jgi:ectoine hydroxylase-related dioxygenase (phytanoyl-CoA dioxygenase family)